MKILYVTAFGRGQGGGAGRVAFEMVEAAKKAGIEAGILYPAEKTEYFVKNGIVNITIASVADKDAVIARTSIGDYLKITKYIDKFNPDLVHSHNEVMVGMIGALWAMNHGKHIILTCHMMPTRIGEWNVLSKGSSEILGLFHKTGISKAVLMDYYKNCSAIVALNDSVFNDLKKFGYKGEIWKIPNGRNLSSLLNLEIPTLESDINLTFAGNISERKNQKFLINVMRYLPSNYTLNLMGDFGSEEERKDIGKIIEKYNLNNINILGKLPFREVPNILEKTHVFISASKAEVQSLAVMEALAAGKPIVGISNETIDEFVDETNGVRLSTDTTHQDFANAVFGLLQDSSKYNEMSQNSRDKIQDYDWTKVMSLVMERYRELLSRPVQKRSEKKISKFLNLSPHKEEKISKPKKLHLSTVGIAGITLVGSVVAYSLLKNFWGNKKK
jgi:glycosyltransferase involved in cell wall biosynthesis